MLIEVKARVSYIIDGKTKRKTETYILDKNLFAEAEYAVMTKLIAQHTEGIVDDYEIQSLRVSQIKEIITQYQGEHTYIATLTDIFTDNTGNEKTMKYKVLLWSDTISSAMTNIRQYAQQGYDMQIGGLKEMEYQYLTSEE